MTVSYISYKAQKSPECNMQSGRFADDRSFSFRIKTETIFDLTRNFETLERVIPPHSSTIILLNSSLEIVSFPLENHKLRRSLFDIL